MAIVKNINKKDKKCICNIKIQRKSFKVELVATLFQPKSKKEWIVLQIETYVFHTLENNSLDVF